MLHEQGLLDRAVRQVSVNNAEYAKFCYLIKVMDAVDRAHSLSKGYAQDLRINEGVQVLMDFDWRGVVNFVQPQLQVVFLQDKHRNPADQLFMRFPYAAIVARNAVVVELDSVFELVLESHDSHPGVEEATNALRVVEATVQSLGGKRMQDGERIVNQLKRVLKLEL